MRGAKLLALLSMVFMPSIIGVAGVPDRPFLQDYSIKYKLSSSLRSARFSRLLIDRNNVEYILTDRGVARVFDTKVALDQSFRPLANQHILDIALYRGDLFYLLSDRLLSNANAGRYLFHLPNYKYNHLAINNEAKVFLYGEEGAAILNLKNGELTAVRLPRGKLKTRILADGDGFLAAFDSTVYRLNERGYTGMYTHHSNTLTVLSLLGEKLYVGTTGGYLVVDARTGEIVIPLQSRLPWLHITAMVPTPEGLWAGTTRGAFFHKTDGSIAYYASKRWLSDDYVVDLQRDASGRIVVLTRSGLNAILFRRMTLADKARHYHSILRRRHIRMGFCGETRLRVQGDVSSGEIVDSDNDGLWSAMYMASEAFRYAVTREEDARRNAWETFAALERLETINPIKGFFARSFERIGFKFADRDRWHPTKDRQWDWKGTTSSDEFVGHIFGYAILYELVAESDAEKDRIKGQVERIMDHIIRNGFYLIDIDGKPTLWGRWSPEYLNNIPKTVGDRRLNSVEIIGALQFAYHITGKERYREAAFELMNKHGYLDNIMISMKEIRFTDHPLGDEWNHSDDELAFLSYWMLYHYAFNERLKRKYKATIREHWEIEKIEKNPLWNFIYASTGAEDYDADGAVWTLREYPLDLVDWRVVNSHRKDLTYLEPNFRNQQTLELLPPDERRLMRWNGNPFILDGGANGYRERAGEAFLLPYWMGRYLKCIE